MSGKVKHFYTITEAAESLGVSTRHVYRELRSERLRSIKMNKRRLIPSDDLDAFAGLILREARSA